MSPSNVSPVVALTPSGPIKYKNIEEAIASAHTTLADPIFSAEWPIDTTYIRGIGLDGYTKDQDPWPFILSRAEPRSEPEPKGKKTR